MQPKKVIWIILSLLVVVTALSTLEFLRLPRDSYLWREILNSGHIPLFGVISLAVLALSVQLLGGSVKKRFTHYIIAGVVTFMIGLVTELAQIGGPRDADPWDQVRNTIGIVIFLTACLTFDRQLKEPLRRLGKHTAAILRTGVIVAILASLVPVALWFGAYTVRSRSFPTICDFESRPQMKFIRTHNARAERTDPPPTWTSDPAGSVGRITFFPPAHYPGFKIDDPVSDWRGFSTLQFDVFSELDTAVIMHITVQDGRHNQMYSDRFNYSFEVAPGSNRISIPLEKIRTAPATRFMDMSDLAEINIFAYAPSTPLTLYFDNFVLARP